MNFLINDIVIINTVVDASWYEAFGVLQCHVSVLQVSLTATQQLCAAGALVSILHKAGAISAPLGDAESGASPLIAIDSISEVQHLR